MHRWELVWTSRKGHRKQVERCSVCFLPRGVSRGCPGELSDVERGAFHLGLLVLQEGSLVHPGYVSADQRDPRWAPVVGDVVKRTYRQPSIGQRSDRYAVVGCSGGRVSYEVSYLDAARGPHTLHRSVTVQGWREVWCVTQPAGAEVIALGLLTAERAPARPARHTSALQQPLFRLFA